MPFVHLPRRPGAEPISLWYRMQGAHGKPELDPSKHTLLIFHSSFADVNGLHMFFDDTRLRRRVNMLAFDQRSHGQTKSTVAPTSDMSVCAADVVLALRELNITQKPHVVGTASSGPVIVTSLAILFPDRFLSFVMYAMSLQESEKNQAAFRDISDFTLRPRDDQEFVQGITGCIDFMFAGPRRFLTDKEEDYLARTAITRYSPASARRQWEAWHHAVWRTDFKPEFFATLTKPILIYHGRFDIAYSIEEADEYVSRFCNAKVQYEIIDGPHSCHATNSSELNTLILQFLSANFTVPQSPTPSVNDLRPAHSGSPFASGANSLEPPGNQPGSEDGPFSRDEIVLALRRAAISRGEPDPGPDVKWQEPLMSEDFCCLPPDEVEFNRRELLSLVEVEKQNSDLIPVGNYWANGQVDQPFDFNYSSRHEYFRGQREAKYNPASTPPANGMV